MTEKRIIRKLKKLASRINSKIESVRDEMDDLEIEFELLQQHINKLEAKAKPTAPNSDEVTVFSRMMMNKKSTWRIQALLECQENSNQFSLKVSANRREIKSPTMLQVALPPRS